MYNKKTVRLVWFIMQIIPYWLFCKILVTIIPNNGVLYYILFPEELTQCRIGFIVLYLCYKFVFVSGRIQRVFHYFFWLGLRIVFYA